MKVMAMELEKIFGWMGKVNASDLHLQVGSPPMLRVDGVMRPLELPPITSDDISAAILEVSSERDRKHLEEERSSDFSYTFKDQARFRVNLYHERDNHAAVFRYIPMQIPTFEELNLPPVIREIAEEERGLVLVTGTTSSGKTTTLAAMVDHLNEGLREKIITVEDPVEYVYKNKRSMVSQLEVGRDTPSFEEAMRRALRQDPDVILVGELRDMETMRTATRAADTGHLVFSTVHTTNAAQTVERIVAMFPEREREMLLLQLSMNLEAVVSLRLAVRAEGRGRIPVCEIMRGTPPIRKYIAEKRYSSLSQVISTREGGMQTFDQHLVELYQQKKILGREALRLATNVEAVSLALKGVTTSLEGGISA